MALPLFSFSRMYRDVLVLVQMSRRLCHIDSCGIDLQKGGRETERHQYCWLCSRLWPQTRQIQTHHLSPERKGVSECVAKRGKGRISCPRQTGRLHFHRCSFCMRVRRDHKEQGGVIIMALQAQEWWWCSFSPVVSRRLNPSEDGQGLEKSVKAFSCLVWLDT